MIFDYRDRYGEAQAELGRWIREGRIQTRTDVVDGLENAPAALRRLFDGRNTGKQLVRVGAE